MRKVFWKIYEWPKDVSIGHSCIFIFFGYPDWVDVWPQNGGGSYNWLFGRYYWKVK